MPLGSLLLILLSRTESAILKTFQHSQAHVKDVTRKNQNHVYFLFGKKNYIFIYDSPYWNILLLKSVEGISYPKKLYGYGYCVLLKCATPHPKEKAPEGC